MSLRSRVGRLVRRARPAPPPDPTKATAEDLVACYRLLLGRAPDAEGLRTYTPMLGTLALHDLVTFFVASPEFKEGRHCRTIVGEGDLRATTRVDLGTHVIHVLDDDPLIGGAIRTTKRYEPHVTRQLTRALRPGMTFVDVGASVGFFTLLAAVTVGPAGHVYAFEPSPVNCKLLSTSILDNGIENVALYPAAVSDVEQLLLYDAIGSNGVVSPMPRHGDAAALAARTIVRSVVLDRVLDGAGRVDVLKIDVEGAEYRALAGAGRVLREHRPLIVSEFGPAGLRRVSGVEPDRYLQLFVDLGYELGVLAPDGSVERHGTACDAIVAAHASKAVDHLDIVAFDPVRHDDVVR